LRAGATILHHQRIQRKDTTLIIAEIIAIKAYLKEETPVSKKKKDNAPMPAASAGLLRFFEEETEGVKIRPELLVVLAVALIVVSVLAKVFFPV
jgi:preprotein translocase subunit Sec61beta